MQLFRATHLIVAACALLLWFSPAKSADIRVDLELVLAVDVSLSMDAFEQKMQLQGYVAAMQDPQVLRAIEIGPHKRIAVIFIEWGGENYQNIKVPWMLIDGKAAAISFSKALARHRLTALPRTSISSAALFSATLFEENGFNGSRRVIDISGDGPNNQGVFVHHARDAVVSRGITINGLPVMLRAGQEPGFFDLANLDVYYEDCVIGGPGAFIVRVRDEKNFANAIRRKLILEVSGAVPRIIRTQLIWRQPPRVDCQIGEKLWDDWLGYQD